MSTPSPLKRLIDEKLQPVGLDATVTAARTKERPTAWRPLAKYITDQTGEKLPAETLRGWYPQFTGVAA